ncbi:hypothetical protein [Arthrobacter sp. H20]|uniref:hypothetical protein n=1 Tax=Arthrobacter sp. H20 TaxID=1267981 RepID=UPI0004BC933B|nr:hypothetical protein [Arthrobacter sp. H20]
MKDKLFYYPFSTYQPKAPPKTLLHNHGLEELAFTTAQVTPIGAQNPLLTEREHSLQQLADDILALGSRQ